MSSSTGSRSPKPKQTREMRHLSDTDEESGLSPPPFKRQRLEDPIPVIPSSSKGKGKIGEDVECEPDLRRCGICLSEEGRAVRGCVDICDHYFCFVCIMEWSKIESRCPMCKRRFDTIRRLAKLGVYESERVVKIPVRDQVFNGLENTSVCPLTPTPYSEAGCTVCKSEENGKFLLLCDLCDAATHTYCAGLDVAIPEGDWYCNDCSIAMDEHSNSEMNTDSDPQLPQDEVYVSVVDIVHEPVLGVARHSSTMSSSPVDSYRNNLDVDNADQGFRRIPPISSVSTSFGGTRSLRRSRNIHGRLRALRENWNAYRINTFGFSFRTNSTNGHTNVIREYRAKPYMGNSCATLMASSSAPGRMPCNVSSSNALSSGNSPDIQKAWAMLDAASKKGLIPQVSRCPSDNKVRSLSKMAVVSSSTQLSHRNPIDKLNNLQEKSNNDRYKCKVVIEQNPRHSSTKMSSRFCERSQGPEIPRDSSMLPAKSINYLYKANGGQQHFKGSSKQKASSSSCTPIEHVQSTCLNFSPRPMSRCSKSSVWADSRIEPSNSSVLPDFRIEPSNSSVLPDLRIEPSNSSALPDSRIEPPNSSALPDSRIEHSNSSALPDSNSKLGVDDDGPKAEIRSLVKLNLKLLSKGRNIGVDMFKEIARRSTHSILAACGLEPPRPGMSSFLAGSVCNHKDQLRKFTLMPNCCRECFYVFVKDVVNSIMSERMTI